MKTCWFCGLPIKGKPQLHHVTPRRYFQPGEDHRRGNLEPAHPGCHRRWHRSLDDPALTRDEYCDRFGPSLGEGVFHR